MDYIFTAGYQGEELDRFIQKINVQNINLIIDIRQNPFSRKPGFSGKSLEKALKENKIGYLHIKELGTPEPLRSYLKKTNDYEGFFEQYQEFIMQYKEVILDLIDLTRDYNICLLCFEKDAHFCHRKVISGLIEEFSNNTVIVEHL